MQCNFSSLTMKPRHLTQQLELENLSYFSKVKKILMGGCNVSTHPSCFCFASKIRGGVKYTPSLALSSYSFLHNYLALNFVSVWHFTTFALLCFADIYLWFLPGNTHSRKDDTKKKKSPGTQRAHNLERVLEHKKNPLTQQKFKRGGQIGQVLFLGKKPSPYLLPFKETFNMSRKTLKIIVRILDPSKER